MKTCAQKLADDLGANAAHGTTAAVDTEHRELGAHSRQRDDVRVRWPLVSAVSNGVVSTVGSVFGRV